MTEIIDKSEKLPTAVEQFILRWGDMGGQWGVNRSVAQIHALLYLSDRPLTAEDISQQLGLARSNVSNSLHELMSWKLVRRVPVLADRRDHFEAETDLWQMATRIAAGRKAREIDPAVAAIQHVLATAQDDPRLSKTTHERLQTMAQFVTTLNAWYEQMLSVPPAKLMALIKLGGKVVSFLSLGRGGDKNAG